MIKAVLLDLDDTLLRADTEAFVREYLRLVDDFFAQRWNHTGLSRIIVDAARHIMGNQPRDVQQTNGEVMLDALAQATGQSVEDVRTAFEEFHSGVHPVLKRCTEPVPDASALVQFLTDRGYAVVIATNPIYAAEATYQRLSWAGLPPDADAYALVTHSGNMHFAKPDPAYYAEIVARVGVEPDEAVMVGDSIKNDIRPAAQLGLSTYCILANVNTASPEGANGTLHDFYLQVSQQAWLDTLPPRPLTPQMIEPELRGNVGALFGILGEVKPHYWGQHPDPNEWSVMQVVCHLLESERSVQRPRLQRILEEDNPFLVAPHPPPGPQEAIACDYDGIEAARRFAHERQQTIEWLRNLAPDYWQRPARHSVFGPTTLLEMAHFTAQHDRLHLNQLCQTLGRCE